MSNRFAFIGLYNNNVVGNRLTLNMQSKSESVVIRAVQLDSKFRGVGDICPPCLICYLNIRPC